MLGLVLDVNTFDSGTDFDLDATAYMVGANRICQTEKEIKIYHNSITIINDKIHKSKK